MATTPQNELLVDRGGTRYFIADLPAFGTFGRKYDALVRASIDAIYETYRGPEQDQRLEAARRRNEETLKQLNLGPVGKLVSRLTGAVFRLIFRGVERIATDPDPPDASKREPVLPHGQVRILIGERKKVSDNQRALFDWLLANQDSVAREVRTSIYDYYAAVYPEYKESLGDSPATPIDLPEVVNGNEIDDNLRLTAVELHSTASQIGLVFDCTWEEEHGLGVLIEGYHVKEVGYAEMGGVV